MEVAPVPSLADAVVPATAALGGALSSNDHLAMKTLKLICLTLFQLFKQACLLPQTAAQAVRERRQQAARNEREAERLDRIRNPSKYLGKE